MKRLLLTALTLALIAAGATVVFASIGDDSPGDRSTTATTTSGDDRGDRGGDGRGRDHPEDDGTVDDDASAAGVDISGNCDEPEHFGDAECQGVTPATDDGARAPAPGVDISGNCDEPEHFGDAECQGVAAGAAAEDHGDDDAFEDSSGPSANSGPGSISDDDGFEDSSGHGENGGDSGPG